MNPKLISLLLIVLFLSCKKDDETPSIPNNQSTIDISFNVINEYFNSNLTGDLVLSNASGETTEVIEIENNQSYQLSITSEEEAVFLSFIQKSQPSDSYININTFVIRENLEISIAKNPNLNLDKKRVGLNLSNFDFDTQDLVANGLSIGGSGGMMNLGPYVFPADILVTLNIAGEETRKVYFQENVEDSFSANITLNDLTDVVDSTTISYPVNGYVYSDLKAKRSDNDDFYYKISNYSGQVQTNHKHYLPLSDFNDFLLETSSSQGDLHYFTLEHFTSFNFDYQIPDFDYNIVETSIESIKLDGGEDCNYYSLLFRDFNNQDFNILWNFHGQFAGSVETSLPNLEPYLQSLHTGYNVQTLDYIHTQGYKIEEPYGYNKFIESKIERYITMKNEKNKIECIEKED